MRAETVSVDGFEDQFGRNLAPALWTMPGGKRVLCCRGDSGFVLYDADDWNNAALSDYEADADGHVMRQGRFINYDNDAWTVPEDVRANAIS